MAEKTTRGKGKRPVRPLEGTDGCFYPRSRPAQVTVSYGGRVLPAQRRRQRPTGDLEGSRDAKAYLQGTVQSRELFLRSNYGRVR